MRVASSSIASLNKHNARKSSSISIQLETEEQEELETHRQLNDNTWSRNMTSFQLKPLEQRELKTPHQPNHIARKSSSISIQLETEEQEELETHRQLNDNTWSRNMTSFQLKPWEQRELKTPHQPNHIARKSSSISIQLETEEQEELETHRQLNDNTWSRNMTSFQLKPWEQRELKTPHQPNHIARKSSSISIQLETEEQEELETHRQLNDNTWSRNMTSFQLKPWEQRELKTPHQPNHIARKSSSNSSQPNDKAFLVPCRNNCTENGQVLRIQRKDLNEHLTHKCPRRPFRCPHCSKIGEHHERTTSHLETCPWVRVQCPNTQCHASIPRCKVSTHQFTCDYEPVSCKFAEVGCEERPLRKDLRKHEEDYQCHGHQHTINDQVTKSGIFPMENSLKPTFTTAPFRFNLSSFKKHREGDKQFYSPYFYSSLWGYKLCVKVCANGCGNGWRTHVSISALILKGCNDKFLKWPVPGGFVTFELLNQLEDKNHTKMTARLSDKITRVMDNDKLEIYEMTNFISHTDLDYQPDKNCQYLKDDTLVFRISVEIADQEPASELSQKCNLNNNVIMHDT